MTRVHASHHSRQGTHRPIERVAAVHKKKKPYKIVLESVTKEKKKLQSILSYTADAPRGYSFVPVGHPQLTEYCKDRCRERNLDVHIVSAKPKNRAVHDPDKLSNHVHRVGHHFPNDVVEEACDALGYYYRNGVIQKSTQTLDSTRLARSLADHGQRMNLHNRPVTEVETKDQIRSAVRDLFPKIPVWDLEAIVSHAFEEGTNRVGNAKELSIARRVQLAVVAHIRHNYTKYDKLLRTGSWFEARAQVEHVSLSKLKEWRDENDSDEIEETFREVIVLDDDDDDMDDGSDSTASDPDREHSLEIVSRRAPARELLADDPGLVKWDEPTISGSTRVIYARPYAQQQLSRAHTRPAPPYSMSSTRRPPQNNLLDAIEIDGRLHNLIPVGNFPAVQYASASSATRERCSQLPQRVNSHNSDPHSRSAPSSRRHSEQDVVLPSVEVPASAEIQSPKRKDLPTSLYDVDERHYEPATKRARPAYPSDVHMPNGASYNPTRGREPGGIGNRPTMPPTYPYVDELDLTSSPNLLRQNAHRAPELSTTARPYSQYAAATPGGASYVSASSRQPPIRRAREVYYDALTREVPRPCQPEYHQIPARGDLRYEYVPVIEDLPYQLAEEPAYSRSSRSLLHR